jgi:phenylacetate-coenzyme A ligase PaaK-like adenylate-forming protein
MPFIRYDMGDLVEVSHNKSCPCNRGLPLKIKKITGRIDDVIFSPEGRLILPVTIRMVIKPLLETFENYQFKQIGKKEYVMLLEGRIEERRKNLFIKVLKEILGNSAKIEVREVEKIITKVGKIRNVVNLYK